MDPKNYQNSSAGKPIHHPHGCWYFLPTDLPPDPSWSQKLVSILAEVERNLARLASLGISPVNLNWIVQPFIRREAVVSTRIGGMRAAFADLSRTQFAYQIRKLEFYCPDARIWPTRPPRLQGTWRAFSTTS